jgi:hypothetical protein
LIYFAHGQGHLTWLCQKVSKTGDICWDFLLPLFWSSPGRRVRNCLHFYFVMV